MEFEALVRSRRSIRQFLPDPIADEEIRDIIDTATWACNQANEQNWQFLVIKSAAVKKEMLRIVREKAAALLEEAGKQNASGKPAYVPQEFYLNAPVIIGVVATGKYLTKSDLLMLDIGYSEEAVDELRCRGNMQTIGAVTQLILLAAWEKGYGGCWMTGPLFARKELQALLGITGGSSLAALIPVGKPASMPPSRGRKPIDEVAKFVE